MRYITKKDRETYGCAVCSELRYDEKKGRCCCEHDECIYAKAEDLEWWKEVGGKILIPEG